MALTVTPGSSSADSYGTLAEFQTYAASIAFDLTGFGAGDDQEQEVAMRKAVHYLDRAYMSRWIGYRSSKTQALEWPRRSFRDDETFIQGARNVAFSGLVDGSGFDIDDDEIPDRLKTAQFEAAILSLGGTDLNPTVTRGSLLAGETAKAGPVSVTSTFNNSAGDSVRSRLLTVEGLLEGLSNSTPGSSMGGGRVFRG